MMLSEFLQLPETVPESGKIGDRFLSPDLAKQKSEKGKGHYVTFYEIVGISQAGNIEYVPVYDILQEV